MPMRSVYLAGIADLINGGDIGDGDGDGDGDGGKDRDRHRDKDRDNGDGDNGDGMQDSLKMNRVA